MVANVMKSFLGQLRVGEPVEVQNLTLVPLLGGHDEPPQYLTLDEALDAGTLGVTEVTNDGHVPELAVENTGEKPVLLLDGEELVGAKQNRILNLTVLVPGETKLVIHVSCVEQGRWRSMSTHFQAGHYSPARLRSNKERSVRESLRTMGAPVSDQGQVWDDVSETLCFSRAESPTMAMADAYSKMESDLRKAAEGISLPDDTCGLAAFVVDAMIVVDLFGYQATFRQVRPKLIDSYLIAALSELSVRTDRVISPDGFDFRKRTAETLERAAAGQVEQRQTIGLGNDVRITGESIRGAALVGGEDVLHVSLFPDDGEDIGRTMGGSRMASPRIRRRRTRGTPRED